MADILTRAGCFVAIILMGIVLRKLGFFQESDFHVLSKIVIKITLTCAIIKNFSGQEIDFQMFYLTLMGIGFGILMMLLGYIINAGRGADAGAFGILNASGVNIGNFVMPFAVSFLGPVGTMAVSLFDVGNSFVCLGGSYSVACAVKDGTGSFRIRNLFVTMAKSVPLVTYVLMTILSVLHISLPKPAVELASIIGNSNAFLAMLMIGVGFHLSGNHSQLWDAGRILLARFGVGITLAVLCFRFLPFPVEYRQALVLVLLGPIASAAPSYTASIEGDFGLASAINSLAIIISIIAITTALLLVM